ncbi:MAG: response regulator transcription factor [Actinobacteria bacterium]|nr:MAG: response regulator transcription factor [Actinomycetota bacterium]
MKQARNQLRVVRAPVRVLIVDDHALFAEALMLTLGIDERIDVVGHAAAGAEAVTLTRTLRPDVVLMDLHMPGMDGIQATKAVRRVSPRVRVVMVTASASPQCRQWAREAGAVRYVTKDTPARDLLDTVVEVAAGAPSLFSPSPGRETATLGRTA